MKNQYFGDINDYKKYSLLKLLSRYGQIETTVCWLLTNGEDGSNGSRIKYLEQPDKWRKFDPMLYEYLRKQVLELKNRNVNVLEKADLFESFRFFPRIIEDDIQARENFFNDFLRFAKGTQLVFLDPDNGLEIKSIPRGRKASSKYIYWEEVQAVHEAGHSILIYQHFPRRARKPYIEDIVNRIRDITTIKRIFYYSTPFVVFLLLPQKEHEEIFIENNQNILNNWGNLIRIHEKPIRS